MRTVDSLVERLLHSNLLGNNSMVEEVDFKKRKRFSQKKLLKTKHWKYLILSLHFLIFFLSQIFFVVSDIMEQMKLRILLNFT